MIQSRQPPSLLPPTERGHGHNRLVVPVEPQVEDRPASSLNTPRSSASSTAWDRWRGGRPRCPSVGRLRGPDPRAGRPCPCSRRRAESTSRSSSRSPWTAVRSTRSRSRAASSSSGDRLKRGAIRLARKPVPAPVPGDSETGGSRRHPSVPEDAERRPRSLSSAPSSRSTCHSCVPTEVGRPGEARLVERQRGQGSGLRRQGRAGRPSALCDSTIRVSPGSRSDLARPGIPGTFHPVQMLLELADALPDGERSVARGAPGPVCRFPG